MNEENMYSVYLRPQGEQTWLLFEKNLDREEAARMCQKLRTNYLFFDAEVFGKTLPEPREDY